MSPSWTRKARPQVIGVGALPLQNEANSVSPYPSSSYQKSKPSFSLKKFKNPFSGLRDAALRSKRYPKPGKDLCVNFYARVIEMCILGHL